MKVLICKGSWGDTFGHSFSDASCGNIKKQRRKLFNFVVTYQPLIEAIENNDEEKLELAKKSFLIDLNKNFNARDFGYERDGWGFMWPNTVIDTNIVGPGFINEYDGAEFWTSLSEIEIFGQNDRCLNPLCSDESYGSIGFIDKLISKYNNLDENKKFTEKCHCGAIIEYYKKDMCSFPLYYGPDKDLFDSDKNIGSYKVYCESCYQYTCVL